MVSAYLSPTGEPSGPGSPGVRASDADRDRVVDILGVAAGDGRLTAGELDERLEAALAARTLGELAPLTADLGAMPGQAVPRAKGVIRIGQHGGSAVRSGGWIVPRRLELRARWCVVTLDFTTAVITHDTLDIKMNMRGGSLVLVTGPGMVVDADELSVRYAGVSIRPAAEPGAPATLRVHLAGRMRYGRIEAR